MSSGTIELKAEVDGLQHDLNKNYCIKSVVTMVRLKNSMPYETVYLSKINNFSKTENNN